MHAVNGPTETGALIQQGGYSYVSRAVVAGQEVVVKAARLSRQAEVEPEAWLQLGTVRVRRGRGRRGGGKGGGGAGGGQGCGAK